MKEEQWRQFQRTMWKTRIYLRLRFNCWKKWIIRTSSNCTKYTKLIKLFTSLLKSAMEANFSTWSYRRSLWLKLKLLLSWDKFSQLLRTCMNRMYAIAISSRKISCWRRNKIYVVLSLLILALRKYSKKRNLTISLREQLCT